MVLADDPLKVITINVLGSLNLLYAAMDTGVRTFIYCSSAAALGSFHESAPVDESYPLRPNNTYSASKAAMEMVLRGLWGKIAARSVFAAFHRDLRAGPRDDATRSRRSSARRSPARPRASRRWRDWPYIYIDDAARAAVAGLLCKRPQAAQLFHRASGEESRPTISPLPRRPPASRCASRLTSAGRRAERGPLDIEPAARDFGFRAQVGHREGFAA